MAHVQAVAFVIGCEMLAAGLYLLHEYLAAPQVVFDRTLLAAALLVILGSVWLWTNFIGRRSRNGATR